MNRAQMEMLSVKSAIERTVAGLLATHAYLDVSSRERTTKLLQAVSQYTAALYASGQLEAARVTLDGSCVVVAFDARGQTSTLTFLLPEAFIHEVVHTRPVDPLPSVEHVSFDDFPLNFIDPPVTPEQRLNTAYALMVPVADVDSDLIEAYERAKKLIS